ncbi:MAG: hypothetical protein Fur0025_37780 [Oscillatoriaceae cyanobacterium]
MNSNNNPALPNLSEAEIDEIVIAQADDDQAWEEAIEVQVHQKTEIYVEISSEIAARAAFIAKLHREPDMEAWLTRIIRERIELEEAAFFQIKREFAR